MADGCQLEEVRGVEASFVPIYRVTVMSWCFQFLLDLLWIPLAAYFKDLGLGLHLLGAVFAANLGVRILPNVLATRLGVKTDLACMCSGLACFAVNLAWPAETWAIFLMSAGGGMTFVRAHLSVHGKMAASGSKERLTLASKWCGAARNAGTVVAFALPVVMYERLGWSSVLALAMCVMVLYIVLAAVQHASMAVVGGECGEEVSAGLVEAPCESIPWIDWVMAGAFCVTELMMNVQAAVVPTSLMSTFRLPMPLVGTVQAVGQVVAMSFLVLLSKGFLSFLQKRPLNLVLSFAGAFISTGALWAATVLQTEQVGLVVACLYLFYISAYTAQVTMLECLMGVLDMQSSIIVMGVAEMFGCGFSLVGGYLGPALLEVDSAAPFALQMAIALLTTVFLALTLGHRAVSQLVVCQTEDQYDASMQAMIATRPSIRKSLTGLKQMSKRPESYIGVEQLYRKHASSNSLSTLTTVDSSSSLCLDDSTLQPRSSEGEGLAEALLRSPTPTRAHTHGPQRCLNESVPIPDAAASTYQGRQFKKAMVNFDLGYIDIDTKDYALETADVKQLVITHRRVRSDISM